MPPKIQKSQGHIGFVGDIELFQYGNNIYRASKSDVIDLDTKVRAGARFEGPIHQLPFIKTKFGF